MVYGLSGVPVSYFYDMLILHLITKGNTVTTKEKKLMIESLNNFTAAVRTENLVRDILKLIAAERRDKMVAQECREAVQ